MILDGRNEREFSNGRVAAPNVADDDSSLGVALLATERLSSIRDPAPVLRPTAPPHPCEVDGTTRATEIGGYFDAIDGRTGLFRIDSASQWPSQVMLASIEPPDGYWFGVAFHCHLAQRYRCSGGVTQRCHH